jgi:tetratricopeptide (TPR) repeat protein
MLIRKPPSDGRSLLVKRLPIQLTFYDDGISPLTVALPPYEDLKEIASLRGTNFSIAEQATVQDDELRADYLVQRKLFEKKFKSYRQSATYLNRLASLSARAGEFAKEGYYIQEMLSLDGGEFSQNKFGENLVHIGNVADAEAFYSALDLESNLHANLRLASFFVLRREVARAAEYVEKALTIDPFDYSARLLDGAVRIFLGEYEKAVLSFKLATEQRPNSSVAHTNMAVAYLRLGRIERAMSCLKKSVALDPLNESAVALLADVSNSLETSEEAIPSLRYFVRYEQQKAPMWARLARALIHMQEYGEAIAALKRQSSVEDSADLWNNLGVAYHLRGDKTKAAESFLQAMRVSLEPTDYAFCLAAKNGAALLMREGKIAEALRIVDAVLLDVNRDLIFNREDLSQLVLIKLDALSRGRQTKAANDFAEDILSYPEASLQLKAAIASGLLTQYSFDEQKRARALQLAEEWVSHGDALANANQKIEVLNNVAFVFIEAGLLQQGEAALSRISNAIHRHPYPTATLGLLHLRRGHMDRAQVLYLEAMKLCGASQDRARIRQKWNLELGVSELRDEPRKAYKLLRKVVEEAQGEPMLAQKAVVVLNGIEPKTIGVAKRRLD